MRVELGLALFVGQAFIYNAVTFGLGTFLVASRESRSAYGVAKAAAFTLMIVAYAPTLPDSVPRAVLVVALVCVYASVVLCVLRGVPVLMEARRLL